MKPTHYILLAGFIAAVAGLGSLFFLLPKHQPRNVALPDGTMLMVERITSGRHHRYGISGFPFDLFRGIFPGSVFRPGYWHGTARDTLGIWLSRRDPDTGAHLDFDWWHYARVVDEHGCVFDVSSRTLHADNTTSSGGNQIPSPPPGAKQIILFALWENFPRHQKRLKLELFDARRRAVAELEFPNPGYKPNGRWIPELLPATQGEPSVSVTLNGIRNERMVVESFGFQREGWRAVPDLKVYEKGERADQWIVSQTELLDQTGNQSWAEGYSVCQEQAWKVRTTLHRTVSAEFAEEERWTVRGLPVPVPGEVKPLLLSNSVGGLEIKIWAIAGPGAVTYSNHVATASAPPRPNGGGAFMSSSSSFQLLGTYSKISLESRNPHLLIEVSQSEEPIRLDCRIEGEQVRSALKLGGAFPYQIFSFEIPPDRAEIDFTFLAHRSFPARIDGIRIGRESTRLHFLHGSVWTVADGTEIGQYRIQYVDGEEAVMPILYGEHVRDWHLERTELPEVNQSARAWLDNSEKKAEQSHGVFYLTTWINPRPDVEIARVDCISSMTSAALFLVGLTAE